MANIRTRIGYVKGDKGDIGSKWLTGTIVSGKNTSPTQFNLEAAIDDLYLNKLEQAVYHCTAGGNPSTWEYEFTLSGSSVSGGDMYKSTYDTNQDGIVNGADHATNADKVGNAITAVLEKLSDVSGQLNYNGNPVGSDYINSVSNEFSVVNKKLSLATSITTKLSKINSDGTIDFSNVGSKPKTLSGYGITDVYTKSDTYSKTEVDNKLDSWHKYNGSIEENTVNTTNTDETITFHSIDTSKAYELWFDTSDGQQATVKSSSISGTDITYTVNTPTVGTKFRLLVKGI